MTPPTAPPRARPRPPRRRRWWADLAGSATLTSVVVVVALWLAHRGVQQLAGGGTGLTSAGRLAGLVASDLLLVQVLLMARLPWVERWYGQDRLTRRHRVLGFASFHLMLAHVGLTVAGYAATAPGRSLAGQAWAILVTLPGMLLAAAGTAALVMVVLTSVRAARARLRYESWHLAHVYAYLGVGLALPHQVWTGADFTGTPWARAYWWTLYAAAAGAVLAFRVGLPAWRTLRHRLEVAAVVPEGPGVVSVHLRGRHLASLPAGAGQFFWFRFLSGPGWSRAHPYSLSAAPGPAGLRITVQDVGDGSAAVAALRPGTRVLIEGPYGAMTAAARTRRKLVFLAAGVGLTALRALAEELDYAPGEATLLLRVSAATDVLFAAELEQLARDRGLVVHLLEGPRPGHRSCLPARYATAAADGAVLRSWLPDLPERDVFVCGPPAWMAAATDALAAAGVPAGQVHAEEFTW